MSASSADDPALAGSYRSAEHAFRYLERADRVPHRAEGEAALLEELPRDSKRILDLGCGDGRLLALALAHCPQARGTALDFSKPLLERARERFGGDGLVQVVEHDMAEPLPEIGTFDAVLSSFAIHHLEHPRKRELYAEVMDRLVPAGVFLNLEHVSSPSERLHERFLAVFGITRDDEDPENRLLDVGTQLAWLREIGFEDVDCLWKWRELALLAGRKPLSPAS